MNRNIFKILFIVSLFVMTNTYAQLDTISVISVGTYNVTIHDAAKLKDNPVNDDSTKVIPVLNYGITSRKALTVFTPDALMAPHMVGEPLKRLYKLYAKAGFGNYTTPYGELFLNNLRSKEVSWGVHLKHLSSASTLEDKGYSGYSENEFNIYGKKFIRKHTLSGELNYNRDLVHCYGYDTKKDTISSHLTKNLFQNISLGVGLQSHLKDSSALNHTIAARFYNYSDNHNSAENNIFVDANLFTHYMKQRIDLETSVNYFNYHQQYGLNYDTVNDALIRFAPSLTAGGQKLNCTIGVDVIADAAVKTKFHFYPKLEVNYDIIDHIIIPYGGIRGGMKHNGYRSLSMEDPFLRPTSDLRNTDTKYEFYAGLRGSLSSYLNYNVFTSFAKVNDQYFFVNDYSEILQNRFNVVYDSVKAINFHAELGYKKKEKISFVFKGDYFKYYMRLESQAWHRPQMQLTFTLNYNLKDKIIAHADVFVIGKQFATKPPPSTSAFSFVELNGITDVNLGLEYRYNKKLSGFVNFSNMGSIRYERWQNYPTQRFQFLAGLSYCL